MRCPRRKHKPAVSSEQKSPPVLGLQALFPALAKSGFGGQKATEKAVVNKIQLNLKILQ